MNGKGLLIVIALLVGVFLFGLTPYNKGYYYPGNPNYNYGTQPQERSMPELQLPSVPYSPQLWNLGYQLRSTLGGNVQPVMLFVGGVVLYLALGALRLTQTARIVASLGIMAAVVWLV